MNKDELIKENNILKHRLNDIVFGDDAELGARYLRKIGYIDFDEEKKLYINKHNNEPFWHEDEKEKDYYIKDEELDEYTKQLEYKYNKQKEALNKIKKNNQRIIDYGFDYDGFNNVEDLKKLIDMLVDYARKNNELLGEIE